MPSHKNPGPHRLRNILVIVVLFLVLIVLIRGYGSGSGGTSKEASAKTFTLENYGELATDPNSFKGASVYMPGRLLKNPEVKGNQTSFQMFADPKNSEWNTIVHTDAAPSGLSSGDEVTVQGTVKGSREGQNALGGTVKAVEVDAKNVEITKNKAN